MTNEEKQLLTKDIFGRVLTGLKVDYNGQTFTLGYNLYLEDGDVAFESYPMKFYLEKIEIIKPYLRPMSSMTSKEWMEYCDACLEDDMSWTWAREGKEYKFTPITHREEFLNTHHFDYRGLIEMGLAMEAPEGMYKTE